MNRREFLHGTGAATHPAGTTEKASSTHDASDASASQWPLTSVSRRAMACEFSVLLNAGEFANSTQLAIGALEIAAELEQQLSYFVESSDLCRMNRLASQQAVHVPDAIFQLLEHARQLHEWTDGAFDITASPLWRLWGFHRRAGRRPTDAEIAATLPKVGMHHLQLYPDQRTVRFARPDVEVNLGGIGKGFAVDQICEQLLSEGLTNFLVQAGGSSIRSCGFRAGHAEDGWPVHLPHPWKRDEGVRIALRDRALGTSGSSQQSFHHQGVRYGHILDPRTGMPASELISTTVICSSAATADALATACYVMGGEGTREFCERHADMEAILIYATQSGQVEYWRSKSNCS